MNSIQQLFAERFGYEPAVVTSAPGRIEVIGNHTDYNGGTVVGACVEKRLNVAMSLRDDDRIRLFSTSEGDTVESSVGTYNDDDLPHWTSYPLGVFDEFRILVSVASGFDLLVDSNIPTGEGLSSSAAIEMATALALNELLKTSLSASGLVRISHRAENRYVGVPCGVLDQSAVGFGKKDHLVVIDASTGRHHLFQMPEGLQFFVFRTHIRHELLHSPYETRHRECRNALIALINVIPGIRYLAHLHPADITAYDIIMDETLARRAKHVVEEQRRVGQFLRALHTNDLSAAGQTLTASHQSSKTLFENSTPELDFLVELLTASPHVLGARLSGAGWGGAVIALATPEFTESNAERVANAYQDTFEARSIWWATGIGDGARVEKA